MQRAQCLNKRKSRKVAETQSLIQKKHISDVRILSFLLIELIMLIWFKKLCVSATLRDYKIVFLLK